MTATAAIVIVVLLAAAQAQIQTIQVKSTLLLDTTSYSSQLRVDYSSRFVADVSAVLNVDRSRLVLSMLTSTDSLTSMVSFVILPSPKETDPTPLDIFNSYNAEIHRPNSQLLKNDLAIYIDLTQTITTAQVTIYLCSNGLYAMTISDCPPATAVPSDASPYDATVTIIEIASIGVIVVALMFILMVIIRRRRFQRQAYQAPPGTSQATTSAGLVLTKIVTGDDAAAAVTYANPYRDTQPVLSASFGSAQPYPAMMSPPMSAQGMPTMTMVPVQYAIGPLPTAAAPPAYSLQDLSSQAVVMVDPMSMSASATTTNKGQTSRVVKKGMNLKQIRQRRIGLDAPQIDQGDESMPDTDTDF